MTERKQINWITGLKGIACIGVMLMHFRGAFMMDGTTNAYQLSKGVHFLFGSSQFWFQNCLAVIMRDIV